MAKTVHTPGFLKLFKPKHDFFVLLEKQAHSVHAGMVGLRGWFKNGTTGECTEMHEREHQADDSKRQIEKSLNDTFVTPFDREEIYDLSERLDLILTWAKMMVKDIETFAVDESDQYLIEMSEVLVAGTESLLKCIASLKVDVKKAQDLAQDTRKTQVELARIFRVAMKAAYQEQETSKLIRRKQLYDYMSQTAFSVSRVGEKLLHLSIKNG